MFKPTFIYNLRVGLSVCVYTRQKQANCPYHTHMHVDDVSRQYPLELQRERQCKLYSWNRLVVHRNVFLPFKDHIALFDESLACSGRFGEHCMLCNTTRCTRHLDSDCRTRNKQNVLCNIRRCKVCSLVKCINAVLHNTPIVCNDFCNNGCLRFKKYCATEAVTKGTQCASLCCKYVLQYRKSLVAELGQASYNAFLEHITKRKNEQSMVTRPLQITRNCTLQSKRKRKGVHSDDLPASKQQKNSSAALLLHLEGVVGQTISNRYILSDKFWNLVHSFLGRPSNSEPHILHAYTDKISTPLAFTQFDSDLNTYLRLHTAVLIEPDCIKRAEELSKCAILQAKADINTLIQFATHHASLFDSVVQTIVMHKQETAKQALSTWQQKRNEEQLTSEAEIESIVDNIFMDNDWEL